MAETLPPRRTGLLEMMGQGNSPFAQFLQPRANFLQQAFAGMVGADSTRDAMRGAAMGGLQGQQMDTAYGQIQQEQQQREQAVNQTSAWVRQMAQQTADPRWQALASGLESGALDPNEVFVQGFGLLQPPQAPERTTAQQNYDFLTALGVPHEEAMGRSFSGGVTVNNIPADAGAGDFWGTLGEAATGRYTTMMDAGNGAARNLAQLDQLEGLLAQTPQGFEAAATQFAGNLGIDLGGAEGVQAAQALINQMVPAQRPPGSGPMSDADLELFKQSVPRLINQPGGNALIIQTMRAINQYDYQLARIVEDFALRGQRARTPQEADELRTEMRQAIDALQNPLENFNQRIAQYQPPGSGASPAGSADGVVDWSVYFGGATQ